MNKNILLLFILLLISRINFAAFPIASNQGNADRQLEVVASDSSNAHGFAQMAFNQYKMRMQKVLKKQSQVHAPEDHAWMGPLSFVLMFTGYGTLIGVILAIIALSSKSNKNKGWAIAALLLIPTFIIIMFGALLWLAVYH